MNWIDKEVAFYDFIWAYGVGAHTNCINQELYEDFAAGGDKFEEMKKLILQKFPTRENAVKEFETESGTPPDPQHGREPEPKPLAQYLGEYVDYEAELLNIQSGIRLYEYNSWRELFKQALDAYESTEQVRIRIERV